MQRSEQQIRNGMNSIGIRYDYQLAERLGIKRQTFSYRLKYPQTFTAGEIKAMRDLFNWSDEQVGTFIRSL